MNEMFSPDAPVLPGVAAALSFLSEVGEEAEAPLVLSGALEALAAALLLDGGMAEVVPPGDAARAALDADGVGAGVAVAPGFARPDGAAVAALSSPAGRDRDLLTDEGGVADGDVLAVVVGWVSRYEGLGEAGAGVVAPG